MHTFQLAISWFDKTITTKLQSLILLLLRLYIASIFLKSGIQKMTNWDGTLFLFEYEYHVPLLSIKLAAILATAAELILPVLLLLGLLTRCTALALFVFNAVAVLSYPTLWKGGWGLVMAFDRLPVGITFPTQGFEDHAVWAMMLLVVLCFGAGKIASDTLFLAKMKLNST
ncbi:MAG: hypothetical protein CR975_04570 [Gammaproteobacteria bacterium]|nr:MAG: hypothetical protein CR975_04570 [Gammaproteobacteria bacterium]